MKYLAVSFLFLSLCLVAPLSYGECFTPYRYLPGPVYFPWDLTVADFNHDGLDDIAAASGDEFDVYLSRGDGTFRPVIRYRTSYGAMVIASGDFNNDGDLDLIVVADPDMTGNTDGIDVFLGNGDGTFRLGSRGGGQVRKLSAVAVGDFDGDGNLDAVTSPWFTASLGVLLGNGNGTMHGPTPILPGTFDPEGVLVADFNGDGKLDVASISPTIKDIKVDSIHIYLGNGDGTFTFKTTVSSRGEEPFTAVAGDFNEDGIEDLAVPNAGNNLGAPGNVAILLGKGDGTFRPAMTYPADRSYDIIAADLNADGHTDLVATTLAGAETAYLLLGVGDGTFLQPVVSTNVPTFNLHLASGDFNFDGLPDLAFTDEFKVAVEFNTGQCP